MNAGSMRFLAGETEGSRNGGGGGGGEAFSLKGRSGSQVIGWA
jgi:hypothetical protein